MLVLLVPFLAVSSILAATSPWPAPSRDGAPWIGVWRQVQNPEVLLHLEPERCTRRIGKEFSFFRVRDSGDDTLQLETGARLTNLSFSKAPDDSSGRLELVLETVWLREWTTPFMPDGLKQTLGIATAQPAAGQTAN